MKSESNQSFHQGFSLNEQELRRIHDILCQQMNHVTKNDGYDTEFEVKFENGVIAQPTSLDEITAQENFGSAAIRRLRINLLGKGNSANYKISLQFLDPKKESGEDNRAIRYKIEGDERDWVFVTSSQLDERIGRIKTFSISPSFLRNFPLIFSQLMLIVVLFSTLGTRKPATERLLVIENQWNNHQITDLGQLLIAIEHSRLESQTPTLSSFIQNWNVTFIIIFALVLGVALFSEEIVRFMFPPYNFLWGDYIKTYESKKSQRYFIFVVVILSVILSLVGNYLYDFFKG